MNLSNFELKNSNFDRKNGSWGFWRFFGNTVLWHFLQFNCNNLLVVPVPFAPQSNVRDITIALALFRECNQDWMVGVRERSFLYLRQYYECWANGWQCRGCFVQDCRQGLQEVARGKMPSPISTRRSWLYSRYRRQLVYTVFYLTSNCGLSSSSNTNARSASLNINIKRMLLILSSHTIILYKFMREKYYEIYNLYTMVHYANNSNNAIHGY